MEDALHLIENNTYFFGNPCEAKLHLKKMSNRFDQLVQVSTLAPQVSQNSVDVRNLERESVENESYRRVVCTIKDKFQLVLMCLLPEESIPAETHGKTVQFIRVEQGKAKITISGKKGIVLEAGDSIVIPPKTEHQVSNITTENDKKLKIYTIYTPPEHNALVHQQRQPVES